MTLPRFRPRVLILVGLAIAATAMILLLPPIAQDPSYHNFADRRQILGIPNFFDVVSNVPFAVVSALGLLFLLRRGRAEMGGSLTETWEWWAFTALFLGVGLTAFGSSYYHLQPDNMRLLWDRLPMTICFMSLFAIIIGERIGLAVGRQMFLPLLAAGIGSAVYWRLTEMRSAGDLRSYLLVQFFPLVAIPLMLYLFPPLYTRSSALITALGWYALAKIFELLDRQMFAVGRIVSGHTLKHLAAGLSTYWILRMLQTRRRVEVLPLSG